MTGTATAHTFAPFFSSDLLATRNPETANLCAQTWQAKLEMGLLSAQQLAQDLHSETKRGAPRQETIVALYDKLTALSATHAARDNTIVNGRTIVAPENTLAKPLAQATKTVEVWYVDSINAAKHYPDRQEKRPTLAGVQSVCDTLESILKLDLQTAARPHIDRYNSGCNPAQVFKTPVELYGMGAPLEWKTVTVTNLKPYQVFDTPVELFDSKGPLAWQRGGKN
jgi:hypothetical protein